MFLGIDIGTSGVKAILISADGKLAAQATAPLSVSRPQPLWSEQDPAAWIAATEAAVLALPAELRSRVQGIGLAGQMHGATLLGAADEVLRPAILWNDGRSYAECAELEAAEPALHRVAGNLAMPGFTAPKLAWVRRHEAALFARVRSVLLPKDYVRLVLTGDKASDMSDSAGTLWLDVAARDWSDALLAATGLSRSHMPRLYEGTEATGVLRSDIAARWGMARVPVAAGAGDNAAGAAGIGVIADGDALLSLGTSGVIFVANDAFRPNPAEAVHAFCHCLPGMWHQMSVHLSAASCLDWGARLVGVDVLAFLKLAETAGPGTGPEIFLPYLSGERTPHNDPHVRGALLGLDADSDPGRIATAMLEGVAFALADGLAALRNAGTRVEQVSVIGGGARSRHWGRIIAAALGVKLAYLDGGEVGPALGAARLAQIAVTGAAVSDACGAPAVTDVIEPDLLLAERLSHKREKYRRAYPALKTL
ncbi:xylulokinase [Sphingobium sp. DEHP117]|uniref:xylulokinase n=1 Tax=Sphingobium sp. DEHP117 TaxID=2993436 RepID=UPI0027D5E620|nr:xylulokinase [Sphingobium sp. DEHP117]MDQ4419277.1 xylulokinase [Sphingobium sp. DEHP117]